MLNEFTLTSCEITPLTLAILPKQDENGATYSHVLEEKREYAIHETPKKVIDEACKYFGSSLKGRIAGARQVSNIRYKTPVVVDPSLEMYFFPTASPRNKNCAWIAHSHIATIQSVKFNQTKITFKNGKQIIVDVSYGSMMNQIQRTAQFRYALNDRMDIVKSSILVHDKRTYTHHEDK